MISSELQEARIRKVGVLSVANVSGIIGVFIGFLTGLIFVIFSLLMSSILPVDFSFFSFDFGYSSIIIFPIFYGVFGFIGGAISAFIYNLAAKITKGIKLYSD